MISRAAVVAATAVIAAAAIVPVATATGGGPSEDGVVTVRTRGLSPSQVTSLQETLDDVAEGVPGGAMAGLWVPGQGVWVGAVGTADRRTGEPLRPGLQVPIGSVTKTLTGTIVLQQVQRGRLSLGDRLSRWYPGYPKARQITIEMLLNMSSGIPDYYNDRFDELTRRVHRNPKRVWRPGQLIRLSRGLERPFPVPGEGYSYSNTNTVLLGAILQKTTGRSFEDLLQRRLFDPLRMNRSMMNLDGRPWDPFAQTYSTLYGQVHGGPPVLRTTGWSLSAAWTAGGVASTMPDMRRWAEALGTGEGILDRAMQRKRLRKCVDTGSRDGLVAHYCLGTASITEAATGEQLAVYHDGLVLGASSYAGYFPRTGAVLVVQSNQDNEVGDPANSVSGSFATAVRKRLPGLLGF